MALKDDTAVLLQVGRRVLTLEADALQTLAAGLDGDFVAIVEALTDVKGRVIVSGMGKSGHVARKIAATQIGRAHV